MITQLKINVLVVENSNVARLSIAQILRSDPQINVIGVVRNGSEAMRFLTQSRPDVILMEICVQQTDGLKAARRIMEENPVPIVICGSAFDPRDAAAAIQVLESGAIAVVEKPMGRDGPDFDATAARFVQTVKLMSEVKVVRRWPRAQQNGASQAIAASASSRLAPQRVNLIGIGASTGGPPVLQTILRGLPGNFPVPILIVQHIARGFLNGLTDWLNQTTGVQIHIGTHGCLPLPGHAYLAPDDLHMGVSRDGTLALANGELDNGIRPSVSHLFHSLAETFGPTAVGVLLTGMGRDGAIELKSMCRRGATTIVQDRASSVVHGMPGEAIAIDAATCILPASDIAGALTTLIQRQPICQGTSS